MFSNHRLTRAVYTFTLAVLYALILSGQILGFLGLYKLVFVLPLTLLVTALVSVIYWRSSASFFASILPGQPSSRLDLVLGFCGAAILVLLIFLPIVRWPYSPINETLNWDAGLYHLPKALEMVKTGSSWDLSIAYGEYPYGYESILAFAALLTRSALGFGTAHALTCLFFTLTFWLLLRRYTALPAGASLLLTALILISGVFEQIDSNIWWIFKYLLFTIGKNDLFLGACILAVLLHVPIGSRTNQHSANLTGLALTSAMALAVKPNAVYVVLPAWLWTLFQEYRREKRLPAFKHWLGWALAIVPAGLWAVRNLIAQGSLASPGVLSLQGLSIASNLVNPFFYHYIPQSLYAVLGILLVGVLVAIVSRRVTWSMLFGAFLAFASFILSPASGFFQDTLRPAEINWRFAIAILAFAFILVVAWFAPWVNRLYAWIARQAWLSAGLALVILLGSAALVRANREFLDYRPKNEIVVIDPFREAVGTGGYFSPIDYLRKNVHNSVVWIENGMPFYAFGPGITNSITRSRPADYLVVFQTAWLGGTPGYPESLNTADFQQRWQLVYEDQEGRVYHRAIR